ncbi:hypothetical protein [Mycobacterium sp.]|uniref:hypothetical protein n=1 Tax=Mycobacterium sp. TaxID=1785 RepID=UPI0031DF1506
MPTNAAAPPLTSPAATWKALAHLLAARPTVRLWSARTDKFDHTANLTSRLPRRPAAVPLYQRGRTCLLALDFDTKHHSRATVDDDFARALSWITEAGGVAVTDQSTSGGRHILVPLALGTSATLAEINQLMRLLESRLPSLDKTPMTNPATGCITAPGSPCRQGGYRILDGPVSAAVDALTTRSDPALLPRLNILLGALTATPAPAGTDTGNDHLIGTGRDIRLDPQYTRTTALPDRITAYATTGQLPAKGTWNSHSEARQSVLAHAALHGHSLATIAALIAPGRPWHRGLGGAYTRYGHNADKALARDYTKALTWAAANTPHFRPSCAQDLELHTGGPGRGPLLLRSWLANAIAWLDSEYSGHRYRWVGAAIYQGLAIHAARSGEIINGVPVVGVGGRSLSLATGLLPETTVWEFLRQTRDKAGAPLVRTRVAQGREPDYYALTQQNKLPISTQVLTTTRIENVHLAWKVVGHRHRRIYELIAHRGLSTPADIFAAAHVSTSTGYTALAALSTAGLIHRSRGTITVGSVTLNDIATMHHLEEQRNERIARHQRQRADWHTWLALREALREAVSVPDPAASYEAVPVHDHHVLEDEYLASVVATGPPPTDEEQHALELCGELLGARVIAPAA